MTAAGGGNKSYAIDALFPSRMEIARAHTVQSKYQWCRIQRRNSVELY